MPVLASIRERFEAELLQEGRGGAEQDGLTGTVVAPNLFDVATRLQRPKHAVRVDATDCTDLGA